MTGGLLPAVPATTNPELFDRLLEVYQAIEALRVTVEELVETGTSGGGTGGDGGTTPSHPDTIDVSDMIVEVKAGGNVYANQPVSLSLSGYVATSEVVTPVKGWALEAATGGQTFQMLKFGTLDSLAGSTGDVYVAADGSLSIGYDGACPFYQHVGVNAPDAFYFDPSSAVEVATNVNLVDSPAPIAPSSGITLYQEAGQLKSVDSLSVVRAYVVAGTTTYAALIGDGSATTITVTHGLGTTDVNVTIYKVSTGAVVTTDVEITSATQVTFKFATAPTLNQYRVTIQM